MGDQIVITLEGKEKVFDVLCTFQSKRDGTNYVIYTDKTEIAQGEVEVYAAIYEETDGQLQLRDVETPEQWAEVNGALGELQDVLDAQGKE